jgi:hypothetical protein
MRRQWEHNKNTLSQPPVRQSAAYPSREASGFGKVASRILPSRQCKVCTLEREAA